MNNFANKLGTEQIKKIVFYSNYGKDPCAHLRVRGPMRHLGIGIIDGMIGEKIYHNYAHRGDVIVIQRDFPRYLIDFEKIINLAHKNNIPTIYDIDDLLFILPESHPERITHHYTNSLLPMVQALYEVDLVTTTTPMLHDELRKFNPNVKLLKNYLDDSIWKLRKPIISDNNQQVTLGYMGSESHYPDLELIEPVIKDLLDEYQDRLVFKFWGIKPPVEIANYPQVKWIPAVSYEYEEFAAYFQTQTADIFLAPLVDNPFNQAKSPLKFFEYSALGTPGIYSDLNAFNKVVIHGENGFLANSIDDWHKYIKILIDNSNLRFSIANNAQKTLKDSYLLSKNAYQWHEVYNQQKQIKSRYENDKYPNTNIIRSISHQYYSLNNQKNNLIREKNAILAHKDFLLDEKEKKVQDLESNLAEMERINQNLSFELSQIKISKAWKLVLLLRKIRNYLIPPNTLREKTVKYFLHWIQGKRTHLLRKNRKQRFDALINPKSSIENCKEVVSHNENIDIIICVHNALNDIQKCLKSIIEFTSPPYRIILVDDGSDLPTRNFLTKFTNSHKQCTLFRNDRALGYTYAANIGMRASQAPFLVLLNSDTIVTPQWIDRLHRAVTREDNIGIAGPLSNTASWQSIPNLSENGDWASNPIPEGITINEYSQLLSKYSGCIHPTVPLLNGFCMMIRKDLIHKIGFFDEETFGQGYGEEDDFNLRAAKAGWKSIISDDTYVFHAQSKSYSNDKRYQLQKISGEKLLKKHGVDLVSQSVEFMNPNRVMIGIRSRTKIMLLRESYISEGLSKYSGKKLLFILPVIDPGGGANVILDEAKCMQKMGVNVSIFNLPEYKNSFLENYSHIDLPMIFRDPKELPDIAEFFDAVIASANYSVPWLKPINDLKLNTKLGYYVQGYEALMYPPSSIEYQHAMDSYTMIDGMIRFTKTQWTRNSVLENVGVDSNVVGISVNIDLFRPRDMIPLGNKPVTIVAMIRASSPYRNPEMTMNILCEIKKKFHDDVDIWLFGAHDIQEVVDKKYLDFKWQQLGKLTQIQVASMISKADIFTDFSSHQAMGLSALEAMAAGCSVIVPKNGGATEFIRHKENGMVADTSYYKASLRALEELIEDNNLRKQIQINGMGDVVQYFPERVSYNILSLLFD